MIRLTKFLESWYIIYILIYFKTSYSIHHPFEVLLQQNISINNYLKHPIYNTGLYENKVCFLGHILAVGLVLWILFGKYICKSTYPKINYWIWMIVMIISLILNPNVFSYLLPIFIIEVFF